MKYKLTNTKTVYDGVTLYRIRALKNFADVRTGDLGGWIEKESNLSQKGNSWVSDDAMVYGSAQVLDNGRVKDRAVVYNNARVHEDASVGGCAIIFDKASIFNSAMVFGYASVSGRVTIYGFSKVYDRANISGRVRILGNAQVFGNTYLEDYSVIMGNARVFDYAYVKNSAVVRDNASVRGTAVVGGSSYLCGDADLYEDANMNDGILDTDFKKSLQNNILIQTGLVCEDDYVVAYKRVKTDLKSQHDNTFQYVIGEWAEAENPDMTDKSCARGLHVSNANYWPKSYDDKSFHVLKCKVLLEDIITIQEGKIRCKKLFVERVAY